MSYQQSIIFFGTPEFAVASLDALHNNNFNIKAVVTTTDKPTGRGKKISSSAVKEYAQKHNLNVLQPENLSADDFLDKLQVLNADIFIVVAFRKLPAKVWQMPPLGTFNLHASLLPNYRGAAPINRVIINGEKETGLTTFFLNENIDEGKIIFSEKINIYNDESFGELYERMKIIGAKLLIKTTITIFSNKVVPIDQNQFIKDISTLQNAPKILKPECKINWGKKSNEIVNKIRGLNPVPTANTVLVSDDSTEYYLKVYKAKAEISDHLEKTAKVFTDQKTFLKISTPDGYVFLKEIQLAGKNRMTIEAFLRGNPVNSNWKAL
ncbi:MAG: methionyl-tRNA formyltransferase [Bacteroidales bacterium]